MSKKIRKMVIEDYEKIFELWSKTKGIGLSEADSKENIPSFLKRNEGLSFVCEVDGVIIGAILCGYDGRRGYIHHLVVHEEHRKKGIGNELVSKCLEKLKSKGIAKCHLFIFCDNEIGISFWNKTGWVKRDDIFIFSKKI